ncbi:MAG TPA: histone deacetylase [Bryobacteraceae bacterium]|nr:histone deacetylase [Bryobacteraceae bacterium]
MDAPAQLQLFYCDHYDFPLQPGHKFPLQKYRLLRKRIAGDDRFALSPSTFADVNALLRIHSREYVESFLDGSISHLAMRRIGFPWSRELVLRTLASAGGTLLATGAALRDGFSGNLAGGTHHAFRHEGSGFCVFNDLAVSIAYAREELGVRRAAVIDLDVHQGDGTAAIFRGNSNVFTLSLHGASNFPFHKQTSSADLELPDKTDDDQYLDTLQRGLQLIWSFDPEFVLFQSGVDALESDRLGRLSLSRNGLMQRNRIVLEETKRRGIPVVITLGGGYSEPINLTVDAHQDTFLAAADIYGPPVACRST